MGEFKLFLRIFIFAVLLCVPCVASAYIGEVDKREYVDWSAAPYNKIVLIKGNTFSADWVLVTCTGQYVAPDVILTARHCLIYGSTYDDYQMIGEKIPIETYDGRETWAVLEKYGRSLADDWALLRVTDGRFFSKEYFDYFPDSLKRNDASFPVNVQIAGFGWLRILTPDEIEKIHKKLLEKNMPSYESAENYLDKFYSDFTTLLDGKELKDWDVASGKKRYRLKADKSCELTGVGDVSVVDRANQLVAFSYNGNCQSSEGNSGGAAWANDNQIYGILSRSRTSFDADEFGENKSLYSASSNFAAALKEMKKTSPSKDVLADIISGRKVWNNGSVSDAAKIDEIAAPLAMPSNYVESINMTDGGQKNLLPVASFIDASGASDGTAMENMEKMLEEEKQQIDALGNQVVSAIDSVTENTTNAEIFDILDNLVSYDVKLDNYRQAQKAYEEAKAKEQSLGNRILGAAAIGAGGVGGMMLASGLAEKNADMAAEQDMSAYLATFKCDYGSGMNVKGGESNITLPGANVLLPLYNEYVSLTVDLKSRKEALEMKPGIEAEVILNASETGLYDNESTGVNGTYASVSKALMNPDGADAEVLQAQSDKTSQNIKTGAVVGGVGIVGGVVGDVLLNGGIFDKNTENK